MGKRTKILKNKAAGARMNVPIDIQKTIRIPFSRNPDYRKRLLISVQVNL